mmetsp:Transcript_20083/g.52151  ORF Transcript_20083/g.52151 Transcript_20083/m.52151 type:complete len:403 (+) Transcript_20083:79-1287(+)
MGTEDEPIIAKGDNSRRPANSRFRQQKLPGWRPIYTPTSVLPIFLSVGIAFIVTGAVLLVENEKVKEEEFEYTKCIRKYSPFEIPSSGTQSCADLLESNLSYTDVTTLGFRCECELDVTLSGFAGKTTYVNYGLDNFFQNHRRYVKSRSDRQLRAAQLAGGKSCEPLLRDGNLSFSPCGLIPNSLFNDTIKVHAFGNPGNGITLTGSGIAWQSDLDERFKNPQFPSGSDVCTAPDFSPFVSTKPPNWAVPACQLGIERTPSDTTCSFNSAHNGEANTCVYNPWFTQFGSSGRGYENEDLVVWMRVAALANFRKPWRVVHGGIPDGRYTITVGYNFPVTTFKGKKKIIFSTTNSIGGDNAFIAGCYITVGVLSLVGGIGFFFFSQYADRTLGDLSPQMMTWSH